MLDIKKLGFSVATLTLGTFYLWKKAHIDVGDEYGDTYNIKKEKSGKKKDDKQLGPLAVGPGAKAVGPRAEAIGPGAKAIGPGAHATGTGATARGPGSVAEAGGAREGEQKQSQSKSN